LPHNKCSLFCACFTGRRRNIAINNIPQNSYQLSAKASGFSNATQDVDVLIGQD
jgi:hypothetical protein